MRFRPALPWIVASFVFASWSAIPSATRAQVPSAAASAPPSATSPVAEYAPPQVTDAMLAPPPAAAMLINGWIDAIEHLRARSSDLRIAVLDVRRAEAQSRIALAGLLPDVTASAHVTQNLLRGTYDTTDYSPLLRTPPGQPVARSTTVPTATMYGASLQLNQPLIAPRAWYGLGTARMREELAAASVAERKRAIALTVADGIMAVVLAERAAALNRVGLQAALEREELTRRRTTLGAGTALDVLRAQQDAAAARAQIVGGDEALRRSREALGLALGFQHEVGVSQNISLDDLEASTRNACAPGALEQRADIVSARKQAEVSQRSVHDVRLQFSPTANLISQTDFSSEEMMNRKHTAWSIMGVLTVPIWDGGVRYGLLRDAQAQQQQAQERLTAARRAATVEVQQAQRAISVAESSRVIGQQQRDLAKESERLARVAFANGKATSFELVDAGRKLREAELNLAVQEFEVIRAQLAAMLSLASCSW